MNRPNRGSMADPLAYHITITTYGTWLPGDRRGWTKRGGAFQAPDPIRELEAAARMTEDACRLDAEQRELVEKTAADHCRIRGWVLHAVNCRSNHVHVVVTAARPPERVRSEFKAWFTRRLKELERSRRGGSEIRENWWTERGSREYLNDQASLDAAIRYVIEGQDRPGG